MTKDTPRDHETRLTDDDHLALRVWMRLLTCASLVETQVRQRLRSQFDTTLPRFGLMAQLERYPDGLRMGELSRRMMVTGGNVTTITDQLVNEGLVIRDDNPGDRRAYMVKLTEKGRAVFDNMAKAHESWVIDMFGQLGDNDKQRLYGLLDALKASVRTQTGSTD